MPRLAPAVRLQRRQQLIDGAWRCAARRGFQSLTVDEVCEEAGVSKGAFYGYFDQKEDLLIALLEDDAKRIAALLEEVSGSRIVGVERLRRLVRAMLEQGEDPARLQVRADLWAEMSANPSIRDRFAEVMRDRRIALRTLIEESIRREDLVSIPANALAAILLALGDGLMLHAGLDPSGFRWANVHRALDALLGGLART